MSGTSESGTSEFWADLKQANEVAREQNQRVLDGHIGASAAAGLMFTNQMIAMSLLHPGNDIEDTAEVGDNTTNPSQ
jgi:hypothetical protein